MNMHQFEQIVQGAGWEPVELTLTELREWKPSADSPIEGGRIRVPNREFVSTFAYGEPGALWERYPIADLQHIIDFHAPSKKGK